MSIVKSTGNRPFVLSIAGMDPSAGAGLLSDMKVFEVHRCYGLGVNTANTIQNDVDFKACHWTPEDVILEQLDLLLQRFKVEVVKIGIVENMEILHRIIEKLHFQNRKIRIVWDPILRSSSGFDFQEPKQFQQQLNDVLEKIFLVTPNLEEIQKFCPGADPEESIQQVINRTNLYLKGGHSNTAPGNDQVFTQEGKRLEIPAVRLDCSEKHGSGCILSSAVTAELALGFSFFEACIKAKHYTEKILASNETLLGYHCL